MNRTSKTLRVRSGSRLAWSLAMTECRRPFAIDERAKRFFRTGGFVVLAASVCVAQSAAADTYKCVEKARTTYQDYPCAGAGSVLHPVKNDTRNPTAGDDAETRLRARVAELEQTRKNQELAASVDGVEREILSYEMAERRELDALRARRDSVNLHYAGAPWERNSVLRGIEKEMQSVTEKYAASKLAARNRLTQLRKGP